PPCSPLFPYTTLFRSLSSHIEASSTHALIEYHWGDFKHDPIDVLHKFFDGFLYWANWGAPELALRFPHGILPADLIDGYDLDDLDRKSTRLNSSHLVI